MPEYDTEASTRCCPPGHEKDPALGGATVMVPVVCPLRIGKVPCPLTVPVTTSLLPAWG